MCTRIGFIARSLKFNETWYLLPIQRIAQLIARNEILAVALKIVVCQHKTKNNNNESMHLWIGHSDLMNIEHDIERNSHTAHIRRPTRTEHLTNALHVCNRAFCKKIDMFEMHTAVSEIVFYVKFEMPIDIQLRPMFIYSNNFHCTFSYTRFRSNRHAWDVSFLLSANANERESREPWSKQTSSWFYHARCWSPTDILSLCLIEFNNAFCTQFNCH